MKVGVDELRQKAGSAEQTEEVAQEAMEGSGGDSATPVAQTANTAMQEFVEFKKAEMELKETLKEEDSGGGLSEAITEVLKDPEAMGMIKQLFMESGGNDGGVERGQPTHTPENRERMTPEHENTESGGTDSQNAKPDGGTPEGVYQITPEGFYQMLLNTVASYGDKAPEMTLEQAAGFLEQNDTMVKREIENELDRLTEE